MKINNPQQRLKSLWGIIDRQHNRLIASKLSGRRVLDVGCGYGSLVNYLTEQGFEAEGIDDDEKSVSTAQAVFPGVKVRLENAESLDEYPSSSFDSVVLKDALHHLVCEGDFQVSSKTLRRLLKPGGRLVILDPNPMWILKTARKLSAHDDVEVDPKLALRLLEENSFQPLGIEYFEMIGLPLSGGYVGVRFVPNIGVLNRAVAGLNTGVSKLAGQIGLGPNLCWRYLIHADAVSPA
jgi:SAM-dependent methyltransferase